MKRVVLLILLPLLAACAASDSNRPSAASADSTSTPSLTPLEDGLARTGPLGDDGGGSCVENYSVTTIGNRDFAFDGTVMAIGPGTTNWPGAGRGNLDLASVTFRVNEWFAGGSGETVAIDMGGPTEADFQQATTYDIGTRLLVSGEPRWGGAPLDRPIAYACGGFTRYYEAPMAEEWRLGTAK